MLREKSLGFFPLAALFAIQCLVFFVYFRLRSYDLDGDGFRALILTSKWHQEINITNSWYHYRYWTSDIFLDFLALAIRSTYHSIDFFRTSSLVLAHVVVYVSAMAIATKVHWKAGLAFLLSMAAAPVVWALASYTMGVTTANFWISTIAATLFFLYNISLDTKYLYGFAIVASLDLLHLYPSPFALYAGFGIDALILLCISQPPTKALKIGLTAFGAFLGSYLLAAVSSGFLVSTDPLGYFRLLPTGLKFYFGVRAAETARPVDAGGWLEELQWILFGGEHIPPINGECEIPMFVPELWIIPGIPLMTAILINTFIAHKSSVARRAFLMLAPLAITLFALRHSFTAQRHYMLVVVPSCMFIAQVVWSLHAHTSQTRWTKFCSLALWVSLVCGVGQAIWKAHPIMEQGFGKIPMTEVYGRQAGNAKILAATAEEMLRERSTRYVVVAFSSYQVNPELLMGEFIFNALPTQQISQFLVTTPELWSANGLAQKLEDKDPVIIFIDYQNSEKITATMAQLGYALTNKYNFENKASMFFHWRHPQG